MERGYRHHPVVTRQNSLQRIGNGGSTSHRGTRRQKNLNGKLIALGYRHKLERSRDEQPRAPDNAYHPESHSGLGPVEAGGDNAVVHFLHRNKKTEFLLAGSHRLLLQLIDRLLYQNILQEGHEQFGHKERHKQYDGHTPREVGKEVAEHTRDSKQERKESNRYRHRGRKDCLEKFCPGSKRGRHMIHTFRY